MERAGHKGLGRPGQEVEVEGVWVGFPEAGAEQPS